jgi:hypothetical protein
MVKLKETVVRRDILFGARRSVNYFFRTVLFFGGLVFCFIGLSSWIHISFFEDIQFLPQGLTMCFYGSIRSRLGFYLILSRVWSVGRGFNEYDKEKEQIRIFRLGFPGENQCLEFFYSFSEVKALLLESQNALSGSNLYLVLSGERKILLTPVGVVDFQSVQEIERFSIDLARFLRVSLERINLIF